MANSNAVLKFIKRVDANIKHGIIREYTWYISLFSDNLQFLITFINDLRNSTINPIIKIINKLFEILELSTNALIITLEKISAKNKVKMRNGIILMKQFLIDKYLLTFVSSENPFSKLGEKIGDIKFDIIENIWDANANPKSKTPLCFSPNLNSEKNLNPSVKIHKSKLVINNDGTNFRSFGLNKNLCADLLFFVLVLKK